MKSTPTNLLTLLLPLTLLAFSCAPKQINPYEQSGPEKVEFRHFRVPLPAETSFKVHQGAFGKATHSEPGNEYHWDLAVPYGTNVISVADGTVLGVYEPNQGGKCRSEYGDLAHVLHIEHGDGTVAQYVHVKSSVKKGERVKKGDTIAITAKNGWICLPHLHFGVFKSKDHLYNSPKRKTIPIYFEGIDSGLLIEGQSYAFRGRKN